MSKELQAKILNIEWYKLIQNGDLDFGENRKLIQDILRKRIENDIRASVQDEFYEEEEEQALSQLEPALAIHRHFGTYHEDWEKKNDPIRLSDIYPDLRRNKWPEKNETLIRKLRKELNEYLKKKPDSRLWQQDGRESGLRQFLRNKTTPRKVIIPADAKLIYELFMALGIDK